MAAIFARSSASAVVVSARRRSQAEQPKKRSVSVAAWQKAITEADLEKADVSSKNQRLFLEIKTAAPLSGDGIGRALHFKCSTRKGGSHSRGSGD